MARERSSACSRPARRRRSQTLDITGGAPELQSAIPLARRARARARRARDRPLQPHHPAGAGPGGPRRLPRRAARRGHRLAALLSSEQRRPRSAASGVFETQHPRAARLNALGYGTAAGLALNLVYNPQGPSLPPAQAALEARLQARAPRRALRHRVRPAVHARQHADPALRLEASSPRGSSTSYMELLRGAHRDGEPRGGDVPQPRLRRLAGLRSTTATSTRCWASPLPAAPRMHLADLLGATSRRRRSRCATIATAAPQARARAAAAP